MRSAASNGRPRSSKRTAREGESWAISSGVRSRMQLQRTRDTQPELAVRRLLYQAGLRYWVDRAPLPQLRRRADIVFPSARVAVYIDGCFWHGCPEHGNPSPKSNSHYWVNKLARNRQRDVETDEQLRTGGWAVVRAWEHEVPAEIAAQIIQLVNARRNRRHLWGE